MPQRPGTRASQPMRTSSSDSESLHHRPNTGRSHKLGDRRSSHGPQPKSLNQKKLGNRIADLESQLGQAQEELKILKDQLGSAEAAKREGQQEDEKKTSRSTLPESQKAENEHSPLEVQDVKRVDINIADDVSEVRVAKEGDNNVEFAQVIDQVDRGDCKIEIVSEAVADSEPEKLPFIDLALKDDEINMLKAQLEEKENKLEMFDKENRDLKNLLYEATSNISGAKAKEEQMAASLSKLREELEGSRANAALLKEKLEALEEAKEALEAEIKKMRVQTEQWRKAADAAAAVLAGAVEMNGRTTERCGSMEKHLSSAFETPAGGYIAFSGSPEMDDLGDGFGSAKRKGNGMKKLGDLWRKRSQK